MAFISVFNVLFLLIIMISDFYFLSEYDILEKCRSHIKMADLERKLLWLLSVFLMYWDTTI